MNEALQHDPPVSTDMFCLIKRLASVGKERLRVCFGTIRVSKADTNRSRRTGG